MIFTSYPAEGSSWADELIYTLSTGSETPEDLSIDIRDIERDISLGRCVIYNVTTARFDVAPYLRQNSTPPLQSQVLPEIAVSADTRRVALLVNGYISETRRFFRSSFESRRRRIFSLIDEEQTIALGEHIRLTAYGEHSVSMFVDGYVGKVTTEHYVIKESNGGPMEIIIPTDVFPRDTERIVVSVLCDELIIKAITYRVVKRDDSARRLLWYNSLGGLECYTFPSSVRKRYTARLVELPTVGGERYSRVQGEVCYELCSAREPCSEISRIAELIFSPQIFEMVGSELRPVRLASRELSFDTHGTLSRVAIELKYDKNEVLC